MTLIASYRFNETDAVFLNDVRITKKKNGDVAEDRTDDVVKQLHVTEGGNHISFFATGARKYWQEVEAKVRDLLPRLSCDNILEAEGELHKALREAAGRSEDWPIDEDGFRPIASATAFFMDVEGGEAVPFIVKAKLGAGCRAPQASPIKEPVLLGAHIEGIKETLSHAAVRLLERSSAHESYFRQKNINPEAYADRFSSPYEFAMGLRQVILNTIESKAPSLFEEKGVSPFMMISILEDGHFHVVGEESTGFRVENGVWTQTGFRVEGDVNTSVRIVRPDGSTQELTDLRQKNRPGTGRLDPGHREPRQLRVDALEEGDRVFEFRQRVFHTDWANEEPEASFSTAPPLEDMSDGVRVISASDVETLMTIVRNNPFARRGTIIRELVELDVNKFGRVEGETTYVSEMRHFLLRDVEGEPPSGDKEVCTTENPQPVLNALSEAPSRIYDAGRMANVFPGYTENDCFTAVDALDLFENADEV